MNRRILRSSKRHREPRFVYHRKSISNGAGGIWRIAPLPGEYNAVIFSVHGAIAEPYKIDPSKLDRVALLHKFGTMSFPQPAVECSATFGRSRWNAPAKLKPAMGDKLRDVIGRRVKPRRVWSFGASKWPCAEKHKNSETGKSGSAYTPINPMAIAPYTGHCPSNPAHFLV